MDIKRTIFQQFAQPTGWLGHVVGHIMAWENRERVNWAVEMLQLKPADAVLEIGFGPGISIERIIPLIPQGHYAGVDHSDVMVQQATQRNAAAVRSGRVALHTSSADHLPFPDAQFDKVLAINSLHIWGNVEQALREVHRVLKPNGLIAIFEQPISAVSSAELEARRQRIIARLQTAGFSSIGTAQHPMKPAPTLYVYGYKAEKS
jgi:ubiquinone/menaquinone biosynthesis C-methylase UbiE